MEQDMKYIYQIWQDRSFTKAAEHLFITQPALSTAVKRVEESIGAPLFDRSRRPLELTEAGMIYIDAIRKMNWLEEELTTRIDDLHELKTGSIRIGGTHYLNCYILAPFLASFIAAYPGIQVELSENSAAGLAEELQDRKIDLMFSCDPKVIRRFDSIPAFDDHVLLAVHKDTPLGKDRLKYALSAQDILNHKHMYAEKVPLSVFSDLEFILLDKGNNLYDRSRIMFDEAGFSPKIRLLLSQLVTAFRMADNGIGAAFICDRLIRSPRSNLLFFPIDSSQTVRSFRLLFRERTYTPFAIRAFAEEILPQIQKEMQYEKTQP